MSKSKKPQTPKIDPRVITRPRLDALFEWRTPDELDKKPIVDLKCEHVIY